MLILEQYRSDVIISSGDMMMHPSICVGLESDIVTREVSGYISV